MQILYRVVLESVPHVGTGIQAYPHQDASRIQTLQRIRIRRRRWRREREKIRFISFFLRSPSPPKTNSCSRLLCSGVGGGCYVTSSLGGGVIYRKKKSSIPAAASAPPLSLLCFYSTRASHLGVTALERQDTARASHSSSSSTAVVAVVGVVCGSMFCLPGEE